ncbi:MAG TPA: hypothetical protein VKU38_11945 [Ktedonobacteraceae bacterium]|nr:hypothetical protein [Ktedonobacteraceae bacterium]
MQKRMSTKRRIRKKTPGSKLLYYLQPRSALVVIAMLTVCLMLVALAASHRQIAPDTATVSSPVLSATGRYTPTSAGSSGATQSVRRTTGIFSLDSGGPIPVPATVLHPSNIARVVLHNELMSIYAGAMTRTPTIGVIAILQENLTTGQQSLNLYQTAQPAGTLTILAIQNEILTFSTSEGHGTFNLDTHQFHFA